MLSGRLTLRLWLAPAVELPVLVEEAFDAVFGAVEGVVGRSEFGQPATTRVCQCDAGLISCVSRGAVSPLFKRPFDRSSKPGMELLAGLLPFDGPVA